MKFIKDHWYNLEKGLSPKYLRNIISLDTNFFYSILQKPNENKKKINNLISNLYRGDLIILKKAISENYIKNLQYELYKISKKQKSTFYKMNKKCPNFWRRQSEKIAKKYSVKAVRDSYYFFRWNSDKLNLWKNFDKPWKKIKILGGLKENSFVKNIPKDGIIDRIQVVKYPENTGYIEPHSHNPINQRLIISVYMSKKNLDYKKGGTCFYKKNKKIDVEEKIDIGDIGIFYGTLKHSVETIKLVKKKKPLDLGGRWWCGLYSPESDLVKNRHTSTPIK